MKKHTVTFSGKYADDAIHLESFFHYVIFISPSENKKDEFACTTMSISNDKSDGLEGTCYVHASSEDEALLLSIKKLKQAPKHQDLSCYQAVLPV